jgi:zinc/manganese transport system permease protein
MNTAAIDLSILWPAFAAGVLVTATHVPLGIQVLNRGIVFIDLAIAQIAGLGVIVADWFGLEPSGWAVQACALLAALAGALLLTWTEKRWPEIQEAIIGVSFVLAASGALLLLASNPHGGEHLKDLLVGQILWVSYAQLIPAALLSVVLLGFMWLRRGRLTGMLFYGLFALAITASVQLVGVYLVFASLIVPALATAGMRGRGRLAAAYVIGALGYVTGLVLSAVLDLPSGALIVWTLAGCALLAQLVPAVRRSHPAHASADAVFDEAVA